MSYSENFDSLAALQFRNVEKYGPNIYGNDLLKSELGRIGVGTVIIPNTAAYNLEQDTVLAHPTYGYGQIQMEEAREFPLKKGGIDVIRSRILTPADIENKIPVINGPSIRKIGASKWAQYELVPEYEPKTVAIEANQAPDQKLFDELRGDLLVVKADMSALSNFMKVCARSEAVNAIYTMREEFSAFEKKKDKIRKNNKIVIQEFVPGLAWDELRGIDENNRQILASAKTTELRIYCFVDRARNIPIDERFCATGRSFGSNYDDKWVSVDQGSVPKEAWGIADTVSDRLLSKTNMPGGFFAIDLIKGKSPDDATERLYVREINTRDPQMVESNENAHDSAMQNRLLAKSMSAMTKS